MKPTERVRHDRRCIEIPSHQPIIGRAQTCVTIGLVLMFGVFPVLPRHLLMADVAAMAILTVIGLPLRWVVASPLGVFCVASVSLALVGLPSQLFFTLGIVTYLAAQTFGLGSPTELMWFRRGTMTRDVVVLAIASIAVSALGLIVWFLSIQSDLSDLVEHFVPDWHWALLITGGLLFAMLNAAVKEMAYRGVVLHALDRTIGAGAGALCAQALAFGVLHINGFPRGLSGIVLATIFGILMGLIRRKSHGLFAPWAAHICADIVIVAIVLLLVGPHKTV